jgi:hypothetical protein
VVVVCVCVCINACVRARVRACVCVCVGKFVSPSHLQTRCLSSRSMTGSAYLADVEVSACKTKTNKTKTQQIKRESSHILHTYEHKHKQTHTTHTKTNKQTQTHTRDRRHNTGTPAQPAAKTTTTATTQRQQQNNDKQRQKHPRAKKRAKKNRNTHFDKDAVKMTTSNLSPTAFMKSSTRGRCNKEGVRSIHIVIIIMTSTRLRATSTKVWEKLFFSSVLSSFCDLVTFLFHLLFRIHYWALKEKERYSAPSKYHRHNKERRTSTVGIYRHKNKKKGKNAMGRGYSKTEQKRSKKKDSRQSIAKWKYSPVKSKEEKKKRGKEWAIEGEWEVARRLISKEKIHTSYWHVWWDPNTKQN